MFLEAPHLELTFANPATDPMCAAQIAQHARATVFHQPGWAEVLRQTYGHETVYARFAAAGTTVAIVPVAEVRSCFTGTRGVCLPFTDLCEPLVFDRHLSVFEGLRDLGVRRGWKYLEIRGHAGLPADATPSTQFYEHELDLTPGFAKLFAGVSQSIRRAIRKAESSGLNTEISSSVAAVQSYFDLHVATRRRHGLPPQPWSFFRNLHRFLLAEGRGFIVLAKQGNKAVAGAVYLCSGTHAIYKYAASNLAFQELSPSNLVMSAAVRHLADSGFEALHFGRTSFDNEGLLLFKQRWGTTERTLNYYRFDLRTAAWTTRPDRISGKHNHFFRRMPLALNRVFGALLYPHLD